VIARRRVRLSRFRLIKRLAAAAVLLLLANGGLRRYANHKEQARLERLGSVLFLLGNAESAEEYGWLTTDPVTLESLAAQLRRMQFVNN
jgi:hypothetical protein